MIPPFNDDGYLPPGIHRATIEEVAERFGAGSEVRRAQLEGLREAVELARRAGVRRFVINGSFVTEKIEPNDVDCVLLGMEGYPLDEDAADRLESAIPYLSVKAVEQEEFEDYLGRVFALDQRMVPKGMVELIW